MLVIIADFCGVESDCHVVSMGLCKAERRSGEEGPVGGIVVTWLLGKPLFGGKFEFEFEFVKVYSNKRLT